MRLVSFAKGDSAAFGALLGERVIDMAAASVALAAKDAAIRPLPSAIEDFLARSDELDAAARAVLKACKADPAATENVSTPVSEVKLLPPVPRPPKIICVARNYAEHAKEAGLELPKIPILFPRFANTFVGQNEPVAVPPVSHQVDWEGELAVILGWSTHGRITKAEAMGYVYGYSIFNDVTVRDYQFRVNQYTGGKNFRRSGPFGPCIVTADEFGDPHNKQITTRLNGEVMQSANTETMIFDIPTILEHIAEFIDLEAGDVIPTGTPAGVGFKRNPPVFLKDGDVIEVEIEGIGTLVNPVLDEGKI